MTFPLNGRQTGRLLATLGLLGIATEVVLYLWPDQVPDHVFSHPLAPGAFVVAQLLFFLHHAALTAAVLGVVALVWPGAGRLGRAGGALAVVGCSLWALTELVAIPYARQDADAVNSGLVGSGYGIGCTLAGIGMVMLGTALLRRRGIHRPIGLAALVLGVAEFLVLAPGLLSGRELLQHAAIAVWMALFTLLGVATQTADSRSPGRSPSTPVDVGRVTP